MQTNKTTVASRSTAVPYQDTATVQSTVYSRPITVTRRPKHESVLAGISHRLSETDYLVLVSRHKNRVGECVRCLLLKKIGSEMKRVPHRACDYMIERRGRGRVGAKSKTFRVSWGTWRWG